jgi:hypothetical protein
MTTVVIGGVTVDADDPCALLSALRPAYLKMLAGETIVSTSHEGSTVMRAVGASNLAQLRPVIRQLESECRTKQGKRRRAIVAG